MPTEVPITVLDELAAGRCPDPFAWLGVHGGKRGRVVRTVQPQADVVNLLDREGRRLANMERIHPDGVFEAQLPGRLRSYRFGIEEAGHRYALEDAYRFGSSLGDLDLYLLTEGSHEQIYRKLGAQIISRQGVKGTCFAVWAPNASRVSVIGEFNGWDGRRHVMRLHPGSGIWEIFIPAVGPGDHYKFELLDCEGKLLPLKTDPMAHFFEAPPGNASIVYQSNYRWRDRDWMGQREVPGALDRPISVYEVHLGSWRRHPEQGNRPLTYRELAVDLVDYVSEMGYTHVEFLPVTEHPFDGSWGYQPIGMYAPTQRFGEPDDFRYLVDCLHLAGVGVIMDWVPAHFPRDEHGLGQFDGTALYEHADPRKGAHADWGTLIFNYGRREVVNYLIGSALYWIEEFHIDGLRVDAVASMLYLDYSRKDGEWVPNEFGGNENLEAVEFLKRLNVIVHGRGATCHAEESTAWPAVSRPTESGGLGFTYKWNMGWMHDTLSYMREEPVHRKYHHDKMTFGLVYAFNENFILPLSHDEVVHGKRSLLGRMPGDDWQRFANLRAYYGFMYGHPGKKLLFMGGDIAQPGEWNHDASLDWHLTEFPAHRGVQSLVRDLNRAYVSTPALHQQDCDSAGFEWIDWGDRDQSIYSWLRFGTEGQCALCVSNLTPVVRHEHAFGVPFPGRYRELINTDRAEYGGSDVGHGGVVTSVQESHHGRPNAVRLTLPPLATLILQYEP